MAVSRPYELAVLSCKCSSLWLAIGERSLYAMSSDDSPQEADQMGTRLRHLSKILGTLRVQRRESSSPVSSSKFSKSDVQ